MRRLPIILFAATFVVWSAGVVAQSGNDLFQQALSKERAEGQIEEAIRLYERVVKEFAADRALAARALVQTGRCYERLGKIEAKTAYERVLHEYADQRAFADEARTRLAMLPATTVPGSRSAPSTRRLWAGSGIDVSSAPSADGRHVSMVDYSTGNVVLVELATGRRRVLTRAAPREGAIYSLISHDGRRVAYSWYAVDDRGYNAFDLRVVAADGAPPRSLYRNPEVAYVQPADWSSDQRQLLCVVARKDRTRQIAVLDVTSATLRVLKTTSWDGPGAEVLFSPDARYLAYDLPQNPGHDARDVFVMTADGSRETAVVRHPANDRLLGWVPDGKQILFASDRTRSIDAWTQQIADGKAAGPPELVKRDLGQISPMGFTGSGAYYHGVSTTMRELYVASLDLRAGRVVVPPAPPSANAAGRKASADWAPDGSTFAYATERSGPSSIFIHDIATGEERELKTSHQYVQKLHWVPDGRSLAFRGHDNKHGWGLYRIDVHTGVVTAIDAHSGVTSDLAWSPDGAQLFYAVSGVVFVREIATGAVKRVFSDHPTQWGTSLALSPDGRTLVVTDQNEETGTTSLQLMPAAGGERRELLRVQAPEFVSVTGLVWDRDGQNLIVARSIRRPRQNEHAELWRVPIDGGAPQRLGLSLDEPRDLRLHPDGRQIAYVAGEYGAEIWVMENFLPAPPRTPSPVRPGAMR